MNTTNLLYGLLCLSFSVIIGAAVFEHLVIWPTAYAAPPVSLHMFQGEYGIDNGLFWTKIHPITLLLFIICLAINWKSERKPHVLFSLIGYVIVMVITMIYFVPELIDITSTPYADQIDASLVKRGQTWEILSLVRLAVIIGIALFMYLGLTKRPDRQLN